MKKAIIGILAILGIGYLGKKQIDKNKEIMAASDEELRKLGKLE